MKNLLLISILFLSLNIFSQTSEEWYEKGDAKVEQNDYKGAISDYTKAIELDPKYAAACAEPAEG
jgi:tetratricopeptide (TPR) repeat protein